MQAEATLPKIFHINWFQRDAEKNFSWPGFNDFDNTFWDHFAHISQPGTPSHTPCDCHGVPMHASSMLVEC